MSTILSQLVELESRDLYRIPPVCNNYFKRKKDILFMFGKYFTILISFNNEL